MKSLSKIVLIFCLLFLAGCSPANTREYLEPSSVSYEIEEDTEIQDQEAVRKGIAVIENNLYYAQEEDLDNYVTTIVESARENTITELGEFFELYDMEHTILGIKILEQESSQMLFEVEQQSVATHTVQEAEAYRDHVSIANHTLVLEDGEWKIAETTMTETFFIE